MADTCFGSLKVVIDGKPKYTYKYASYTSRSALVLKIKNELIPELINWKTIEIKTEPESDMYFKIEK